MTKKPMTKTTLLASLVEKTGCSKSVLEKMLEALADTIKQELRDGGSVTVPGLVKLGVKDKPARIARNPATGQSVEVAATKAVKLTVLKELKETIAAP